jgi:hypothetical protein
VTEHCPALSVQVVLLKVPALLLVNVTVPVDVVAPAPDVSLTVPVQVVHIPCWTALGTQLTLVLVDRAPDELWLMLVLPLLGVCTASPPYEAVKPTTAGVYVTEQLADDRVTRASVQLAALNVPAPLDVKPTVPDGVVAPTPDVSITVAVQIVERLTGTLDGWQLTLVLVDRAPDELWLMLVLPLLGVCTASPPYETVMVCVPAAPGM